LFPELSQCAVNSFIDLFVNLLWRGWTVVWYETRVARDWDPVFCKASKAEGIDRGGGGEDRTRCSSVYPLTIQGGLDAVEAEALVTPLLSGLRGHGSKVASTVD